MIVIEKPKEAGKHCKEGFVFLNNIRKLKGRVGKFEKPSRDTLFVIFHGMLLTSR